MDLEYISFMPHSQQQENEYTFLPVHLISREQRCNLNAYIIDFPFWETLLLNGCLDATPPYAVNSYYHLFILPISVCIAYH